MKYRKLVKISDNYLKWKTLIFLLGIGIYGYAGSPINTPIEPLPKLLVRSLSLDKISNSVDLKIEYNNVIMRKEEMQESFFFPELEEQIEQINAMSSMMPPPGESDPSFTS